MKTYISVLRGINVGGHKIIKMNELKKLYRDLNFDRVQTYLQSGNVIFNALETDIKKLENKIRLKIQTRFGFDVSVIVLDIETLQTIASSNPFTTDDSKDISSLYVTFLSEVAVLPNMTKIMDKVQNDEEIAFAEKAIYLFCPSGYGKTKLNNNFLETHTGIPATTRNWKTTIALLNMALG